MKSRLGRHKSWWVALLSVGGLCVGVAAQVNPDLYAGLQWRNIGPLHGGRIASVSGVIGQSGVYYAGTPQGGIWKTTSAGVTWFPIFDQVTEVDSIGAIQVAPSDPNTIYAGSGDSVGGSDGDGMYKSTDAGTTWRHVGLEDTTKINKIVVDPKNPQIVLASTTGDGSHRGGGVYRSTDGGQTWQSVLKPDGVNGTRDLEYAFDLASVMFATTQGVGGGPGGGGAAPTSAQRAKLFKSTDEGLTWTEVTSLPPYTGRISVAIAMHTNGQRVYVVGGPLEGGSGLYRSDDGGATWRHMAGTDTRISNGQGAYSSGVWVDSDDPNILYTASTALYRSSDGGTTFIAFKGAPGGEDYHDMWIDPTNGQRMLLGVDQGATVTLDGGKTWSTWFNQPIDQVYHVSTDTQYPYWVLAAQQDTGAVMTRSRGDFGQVNVTDWLPLPSSEFGTITADPLRPEILYGVGYGAGGGGSGLIKIDMKTGQWENVAPNFGGDTSLYRQTRDFWKKFDTTFDPHALYVGYQCLLVTRDGAQTWTTFSPDLTTPKGEPLVPCGAAPSPPAPGSGRGGAARGAGAAPAPAAPSGRGRGGAVGGSITDFSLSTVTKGVVWTVSTTGQIYNTMDGGLHWTNVSNITDAPAAVNYNTIETGHQDTASAYVSARAGGGRGRGAGAEATDTNIPLIWRTHDGGKTWTKIITGLPSDQPTGSWVNVIRVDPTQKGLLFAGTETTVYVSFDDGDHWQSLRQNLPSTSIRDMVFHTNDHMNDLVLGTYGRSFWVLDDMSPLREMAAHPQTIAAASAYLFKPGDAIRARRNVNWDQPTNLEVPHAPNPLYGAIIYYHLSQSPQGPITLRVLDTAGRLVRTLSSILPPPVEGALYPDYWLATPESRALPTAVGTNRTNWDLRYEDPPAFTHDLEDQSDVVDGSVTPAPHGPLALPGTYTIELTVNGQVYRQPLRVHNDPRVGESAATMAALRAQNNLTLLAYQGMKDSFTANDDVAAVRAQVAAVGEGTLPPDVASQVTALDAKLAAFGGAVTGRGGRGGGGGSGGRGRGAAPATMESFIALNNAFNTIVSMMEVGLDMPPTKAQIDSWESDCHNYNATMTAWRTMEAVDLRAFNVLLTQNHLQPLTLTPPKLGPVACTFAPPPR